MAPPSAGCARRAAWSSVTSAISPAAPAPPSRLWSSRPVSALLCNGLVPTIVGTPENNTLTGTNGNDVIHGLGAMTSSNGGNGNDTLCGGEGNDGYLKKLTERGAASLADRIDQNIRPKTP